MRALVIAFALVACKSESKPRESKPSSADPKPPSAGETPAPASDVRWGGAIAIPQDVPLEFELRIDCAKPRAGIAIPAQGLAPTDLADVSCQGDTMAFTLAIEGTPESAHARFEVTAKGDRAEGVMRQHGQRFGVTMRKLGDGEQVAAGPKRPQMPAPPFPYTERAARYAAPDGTTLAGVLTIPEGAGKHPAVILVTGTGTQDRDETLFGHKPFWVIADHLSRNGIAVLRVDDRGAGGSGGNNEDTDLETKVSDVLAGIAWLATQAEIDPARIGIVGHSEGGTIAPMAAAASPSVAFIVMLAGPGVTGADIGIHQMELFLRAAGATADQIKLRVDGQKSLIAASLGGATDAELRAAVTAHMKELEAAGLGRFDDASLELTIQQSLAQLTTRAARSFLATDPRPYLAKVTVPTLALWGGLDLQVHPEQNEPAVRAAFPKDGALTTKVFPGLNHLFQPATNGTVDEYATIETTIDPAVLAELTAWLQTVTAAKGG